MHYVLSHNATAHVQSTTDLRVKTAPDLVFCEYEAKLTMLPAPPSDYYMYLRLRTISEPDYVIA